MITFTGDVYLDKPYKVDVDVANVVINLEHPISKRGEPVLNKINVRQEESYIEKTFGKMPLAANLANNHIIDYGEDAFEDTIAYLRANNIKYFGAGNEDNNYNNPSIIENGMKKIALLGYCCHTTHPLFGGKKNNGCAPINEDRIKEDIKTCSKECDFIVANFHWGEEEARYPKPEDVKTARRVIDWGADLVIGHHAHVIQSVEVYKGRHIFYGLGNFIFPDFNMPAYHDGNKFNGRAVKIQRKANRRSIVVSLDEDLSVMHETVGFQNGTVRKGDGIKIPKWLPRTRTQFNMYYEMSKRKRMLENFFFNPKIPSWSGVRSFLFGN